MILTRNLGNQKDYYAVNYRNTMKTIQLITVSIWLFSSQLFSQVEKYCTMNELNSMYEPLSIEIKSKLDLNKANNQSLLDGIGVSYIITTNENIIQFSENQIQQAFDLSNKENMNIMLNSSELKLNFNNCIRIEYVKDRLKSIGIEILELKESMIFLAN